MNLQPVIELFQNLGLMQVLPLSSDALLVFLTQSTLLLSLMFAAERLLKRNAAVSKRLLWFWAIMLVPILGLLTSQMPATKVNRFIDELLSSQITLYSIDSERGDVGDITSTGVSSKNTNPSSSKTVAALPTNNKPLLTEANEESSTQWNLLVFLYCLVVIALLSRVPFGWVQLGRLRRSSSKLTDQRGLATYSRVSKKLAYNGNCQLRLTELIESPVSFGIVKPLILLPESYYNKLSDTELYTVLLHELTHVKNGDPLRILCLKLVESFFFFQPLIWLGSKKVQYFSELIADDSVLETGVAADNYANVIVNLIELGSEPSHPLYLSTGIFTAPRMLVSRIEHLLDNSRVHKTKTIGKNVLTSLGILLVALAATLQIVPKSAAIDDDKKCSCGKV